jgi:hypothetical protein
LSFLRTNYRVTGNRVTVESAGSAVEAQIGTGYIFLTPSGSLYVYRTSETFVAFGATASGSVADR